MNACIKKVLLGSTTILALGAIAQPALAASTDLQLHAVILTPVQITANQSLNFGSLTESGSGGSVSVNNLGASSTGGGVTSIAGTIQAGQFTLKGGTGVQIDVTGPDSVSIFNSSGSSMAVGAFTVNGAAGTINATPFSTALAASTASGFDLGGTLTIGAGQNAGTYAGMITLTANYN